MSAATPDRTSNRLRIRWSAIGAAVAVTLGASTIATVDAVQTSGERLTYVATEPCRLIDTRPEPQFNVGPRSTPLGPTETITIDAQGAQGQCTSAQLPTDAAALALNVTVPTATANGFLTFWGSGDRPNASSLNPSPGQPPAPNAVTTTRSGSGTFNVYNENGFTHLIIDVVGHHIDHNHDDRYYTKTQVDSAIEQNLAQPAIGREIVDVSVFEMVPSSNGDTDWELTSSINWLKGSGDRCLYAPVDVVPGQIVESVGFSVRKESGNLLDGEVSLVSLSTRPDEGTGTIQFGPLKSSESFQFLGAIGSRTEVISDTTLGDGVIRPGFSHYGSLCTSDPVRVFGARVVLRNP